MSISRPIDTTNVRSPRMSSTPPTNSVMPTTYAKTSGAVMPTERKKAVVPLMPPPPNRLNSFCPPWPMKTTPSAPRRIRAARSTEIQLAWTARHGRPTNLNMWLPPVDCRCCGLSDANLTPAATRSGRSDRSAFEKPLQRHAPSMRVVPVDTRREETPVTEKQKSAKSAAATEKRYEGFTAEERAAMRDRVREQKTAGRRGSRAQEADGESEVLAKIAEMPEPDRVRAERIHAVVKASAPALSPRLWYGMPAYARDGKIVCHFQPAQKFKT